MAEPIEEKHHDIMNALARLIDGTFNDEQGREVGFCLMVFPLNSADGRMNYISNARKQDVIVALKEFISNAEGMNNAVHGHA